MLTVSFVIWKELRTQSRAELAGCRYPDMIPSSQKICGDSRAGQGTQQGERGSPREGKLRQGGLGAAHQPEQAGLGSPGGFFSTLEEGTGGEKPRGRAPPPPATRTRGT